LVDHVALTPAGAISDRWNLAADPREKMLRTSFAHGMTIAGALGAD
jgi:hypothetical protein